MSFVYDGRSSNADHESRISRQEAHTSGWVNVRSYGATGADLASAAADALAAGTGILIAHPITITTAVGTVSAPVRFEGGGKLIVSAGGSVTLTGPMTAPLSQVFSVSGGGTLTFSAKVAQVVPQWWGAIGNGTTDDSAALQAAIDAALASGRDLYVSEGAFLANSNLTNLHAVRKRGPGSVKASTAIFYVEPKDGQTNSIFVSPTGVATNDGLRSSRPMDIASVPGALAVYGPVLQGTWKVILAAGSYLGGVTFTIPSRNRIWIQGPSVGGHPNVPTAIFDGSLSGATSAIDFNGPGTYGRLTDVKAVAFTGSSRSGFVAENGSNMWWDNVHTDGSGFAGLNANGPGRIYVSGGKMNGDNAGIRMYGISSYTIGYQASANGEGPIITNATEMGIEIRSLSQGHLDYVTVDGAPVGVDIYTWGRSHVDGGEYKNCTTAAVRGWAGGVYYLNVTTPPIFSGNAVNTDNYGFAGETTALFTGRGRMALYTNPNVGITHNGTGAEVDLVSNLISVAANEFVKAGKAIHFKVTGRVGGTNGTKTIRIKTGSLGSLSGAVITNQVGAKDFVYEGAIYAQGPAAQRSSAEAKWNADAAGAAPYPSMYIDTAMDTVYDLAANAFTLKLSATAAVGDQILIYTIEVWYEG